MKARKLERTTRRRREKIGLQRTGMAEVPWCKSREGMLGVRRLYMTRGGGVGMGKDKGGRRS